MTDRNHRASMLLAVASLSIYASQAGAADASSAFAVIDIQPAESGVMVSGKAFALNTAKIDAEMVIERKGKSGTISTRQSRALTLEPGTTEDIARTGVNFGDGDTIAVTVILKQKGVVIAESTATAGH